MARASASTPPGKLPDVDVVRRPCVSGDRGWHTPSWPRGPGSMQRRHAPDSYLHRAWLHRLRHLVESERQVGAVSTPDGKLADERRSVPRDLRVPGHQEINDSVDVGPTVRCGYGAHQPKASKVFLLFEPFSWRASTRRTYSPSPNSDGSRTRSTSPVPIWGGRLLWVAPRRGTGAGQHTVSPGNPAARSGTREGGGTGRSADRWATPVVGMRPP